MSWQASSLALLGLALAAGFAWYEREKPPARVLAVVAALAALAVVGRLAFAAIPNVKPTTDIVLFAGYALGAVPGFAVGAVTAIVSNIFLSQGPWTVWQMAGWGAVGLGGAALARALRGREPNRFVLAAVCGLAGLLFGAWMDSTKAFAERQELVLPEIAISARRAVHLEHAIGNVVSPLLGPASCRAARTGGSGPGSARPPQSLRARWSSARTRPRQWPRRNAGQARRNDCCVRRTRTVASAGSEGARGPIYKGWPGSGLARPATRRRAREADARSFFANDYVVRRAARSVTSGDRRTVLLAREGEWTRGNSGAQPAREIEERPPRGRSISGFVSTRRSAQALRASGHPPIGGRSAGWSIAERDGGFAWRAHRRRLGHDRRGAQALATGARPGPAASAPRAGCPKPNDDGGYGQLQGRTPTTSHLLRFRGSLPRGRRGHGLSREGIPRPPPEAAGSVAYSSRARRRRDGDRPGADGLRASRSRWRRCQEQADAREARPMARGAVQRSGRRRQAGRRSGGAAAGGADPQGGRSRSRSGGRRDRRREPAPATREHPPRSGSGPRSGAAHRSPCRWWAALLAAAGMLELLWVIQSRAAWGCPAWDSQAERK